MHPDRRALIAQHSPSNQSPHATNEYFEPPHFRNTTGRARAISPRYENGGLDTPVRQLNSPLRRITMDSADGNKKRGAEANEWEQFVAKNGKDEKNAHNQGGSRKHLNKQGSAVQGGASTKQPDSQRVQEVGSFDTDSCLEDLGNELQSKPKTYKPLPAHMRPYIISPLTPAPMYQSAQPPQIAPKPTYGPLPQVYPIAGDDRALISDDEKDTAGVEVEDVSENINVGKTIKPLVSKGKDYDPAVKDLFKNRDNIYVNKPVERKTAIQMIDEINAKKLQ